MREKFDPPSADDGQKFSPESADSFSLSLPLSPTCALQKFDANKRYYKTNDDNMRGGVTEVFMTHFLLAPALPPGSLKVEQVQHESESAVRALLAGDKTTAVR